MIFWKLSYWRCYLKRRVLRIAEKRKAPSLKKTQYIQRNWYEFCLRFKVFAYIRQPKYTVTANSYTGRFCVSIRKLTMENYFLWVLLLCVWFQKRIRQVGGWVFIWELKHQKNKNEPLWRALWFKCIIMWHNLRTKESNFYDRHQSTIKMWLP